MTYFYYNFSVFRNIVNPYAGFGIGIAKSTIFSPMGDDKLKSAFAYQFAVGSKFNVHEHVQLFADLRYTGTISSKSQYGDKYKISFYSINAGVSYPF